MKRQWIGILSSIALAMGITVVHAEEAQTTTQIVEQEIVAPSEEALAVLGDVAIEEAMVLTEQEMADTTAGAPPPGRPPRRGN